MYIYILDSHMAPYGACEVAQSTVRSNAQFVAELSNFERDFEGKTSMVESVFEGKKKHARAVISTPQRPPSKGKRSMLEH